MSTDTATSTGPSESNATAAGGGPGPGDVERLRSPERIAHLFEMLRVGRRRQPAWLTLTLDRRPDTYRSCVVDVDRKAGEIVLDELLPREGNRLASRSAEVTIRGQADGATFQCTAQLIGSDKDAEVHRARLPDIVLLQHRRRAFRTAIPKDMALDIRYELDDERATIGQVIDLSSEGIGLRLTEGEVGAFGDEVKLCFNDPQNQEVIEVKMVVRRTAPGTTGVTVGGAFVDLSPRLEARLGQLVAAFQRLRIQALR